MARSLPCYLFLDRMHQGSDSEKGYVCWTRSSLFNFVGLLFFNKQSLIAAAKTRKPAGRVEFRLVELLD